MDRQHSEMTASDDFENSNMWFGVSHAGVSDSEDLLPDSPRFPRMKSRLTSVSCLSVPQKTCDLDLNDLKIKRTGSWGDTMFYTNLTRAVYHDRLTVLFEKHYKKRWNSAFVDDKLNQNKGNFQKFYEQLCEKWNEKPEPEFIAQCENFIGTWNYDSSLSQLLVYEFRSDKYDWLMYSQDRVKDLFNIVEDIRKQKRRLVLRFIDWKRFIYSPLKFTFVEQKKVAAGKYGSVYRWKHKVRGVDMAEVRIIFYPYDKVIKLDWIQVKRFEMSGSQLVLLLATFCDYLQFSLKLNDASHEARASSLIRKGASWYQQFGFNYDKSVIDRFEAVLKEWDSITMVTKGAQKSLRDDLENKKFLQLLFSLRTKERCPKWTWYQTEKLTLGVPDKESLLNDGRVRPKRYSPQDSPRRSRSATESITILEFLRRVYEMYSICRTIRKDLKLRQGITTKEEKQFKNMYAHIEDLANRCDGYLRKNPRTKSGYNILYGIDYGMTRACTPMSETAYMASVISHISPPDRSVTDANTINSVEEYKKAKQLVVDRLNKRIMERARSPSNKLKRSSNPVLDENKENSVDRVEVCTHMPHEEQKEDSPQTFVEERNDTEKIPPISWEKCRLSKQKSEPVVEIFISLPNFFKAASETNVFNRQLLSDEYPYNETQISTLQIHRVPHGEYGDYLKMLQKLKVKLESGGDHEEVNPLMRAIIMNETEELDYLVENNPADLNSSDDYGRTVIFAASALGHKEVVKKLLAHDALLVDTLSGKTALDYAKACERWPVVKLLNEYAENKKTNV